MSSKKIIIVRVIGGLGNQLFIYAFARYISFKFQRTVYLETKTGFVKDQYKRKYKLNKFNIILEKSPWYIALYYPLRTRFNAIIKLFFGDITYISEKEFYKDLKLTFNKIQNSKLTYLEGYWQDSSYFADYEVIIKEELSLTKRLNTKNTKIAATMRQCNSVAMHLRRVQYDTLLGLDYYRKSIEQIKSQIIDPVFYIFSDDINWCRQNLKIDESIIFIEHNRDDEIAELWLMSQCQNFIIANSTFSWWGAWLSRNDSKIVIAPKSDEYLSYPDNWVQMDL